jgi:hypothetical protein
LICSTETEIFEPGTRHVVRRVAAGAGLTVLFAMLAPVGAVEPQDTVIDPRAATASSSYPVAFRSDVIEIPLKADEDPSGGNDLEYKVHLEKGAAYIYSWEVADISNPEEFYSEFHGHVSEPGKPMTLGEYRKATGTSDHGILTAPFAGAHGWYFQNQSLKPVTVRLKLSGFYTLIPAGKAGNEAGLSAKTVDF